MPCKVDDPSTHPPLPFASPQQGRCLSAPSERVCWPLRLSTSLDADILIFILILEWPAWYFAIRKWFNWSFRKKVVVFRGRRRCWTENQFVLHEKAKVVRATLSGTSTLFTTPSTTQWYFCNILPYLRPFNFWLLWLWHFRAKFLAPRNFCLFACLNFKLVFLYLVPLDICVSRFLSPRTLPTEGYRKSKLGSIFHIQV